MTIDLWCLVATALLGLVLTSIEIIGKTRIAGPKWNAGNREEAPSFPPWIGRAGRTIANHKENFPLFATAVIVVHLAGRADTVSALASETYVAARAVYAGLYIGGVQRVRSLVFLIGLGATLAIFSRLLT